MRPFNHSSLSKRNKVKKHTFLYSVLRRNKALLNTAIDRILISTAHFWLCGLAQLQTSDKHYKRMVIIKLQKTYRREKERGNMISASNFPTLLLSAMTNNLRSQY